MNIIEENGRFAIQTNGQTVVTFGSEAQAMDFIRSDRRVS